MAVDKVSQDFLRVLIENGGKANTTTIRSETGMSRGQVNHRFNKLNDLGWIKISREDSGKGDRTPPKIALLTDKGDQAIRSGEAGPRVLGEDIDDEEDKKVEISHEQMESFKQEINGMKNRLNVVVEQVDTEESQEQNRGDSPSAVDAERVERLEREVARLRETVELLNKAMSERNEKENEEEEDDGETTESIVDNEVIEELKDTQEYLEEWMDVAQQHIVAMRMYMDENDEDFGKYLEEAEDER